MDVFELGFLFYTAVGLGFGMRSWQRVCSVPFIFAYFSLLLLDVLCFVKFCKGVVGLVNLRALGCSTTEKKQEQCFYFWVHLGLCHGRNYFVLVAFCGNGIFGFLFFSSVSLFFLGFFIFLVSIQRSTAMFMFKLLLPLLYIFTQRYYYPFYFLCFIFVSVFV